MQQTDARLWGLKAARAGLTAADNPYRGELARAQWASGWADGIRDQAALDHIARCPAGALFH